MKYERAALIAFVGNFLINNIATLITLLVPGTPTGAGWSDPHFIVYILVAALFVAGFTWWYARPFSSFKLIDGAIFGVLGFVISIATAFVTGVSGVAMQGGFSQVAAALPNFVPFLFSWTTLVLAAFWILPALGVGAWLGRKASGAGNASL